MALARRQSHQSPSAYGGRKRRQSGHGPHKRGLNTKIHLAGDALGLRAPVLITPGTWADCTQAIPQIDGICAEHLLADLGYDTNAILEQAYQQGMKPVIPPRK